MMTVQSSSAIFVWDLEGELKLTHFLSAGSWRGSLFVMLCVLLTCVDVAGFMHWWGITIEITSMNIVIIR